VGLSGIGWLQHSAAVTATVVDHTRTEPSTDAEFLRHYHSRPHVALSGAERHTKGTADAVLTIAEFVDFRCPSCAQARVVLGELLKQYPEDVRIIFRHYPLDRSCNTSLPRQVHATACAASAAAECASEQGKFWEYADLLFSDQKVYTPRDFQTYAGAVSLDMDEFNACIADGRMRGVVRQDIEEAHRINIKATPSLVINGRLVEGLPSLDKLVALVVLEKSKITAQ
jgi:protein-disulfide isomerase